MAKSDTPSAEYKVLKRHLAKRLQAVMLEKGWNQSEVARRAAKFMPDKTFGRDNVSKYLMLGKSGALPTPIHLNALAKALGLRPDDLMPTDRAKLLTEPMEQGVSIQQVDEDTMHIRLNQRFPVGIGRKIAALVLSDEK